jgi:hypothetical protein
MLLGDDHEVPLKVSAFPSASTASQKVEVGQETALKNPPPGSTLAGDDHEVPLKVTTLPS